MVVFCLERKPERDLKNCKNTEQNNHDATFSEKLYFPANILRGTTRLLLLLHSDDWHIHIMAPVHHLGWC